MYSNTRKLHLSQSQSAANGTSATSKAGTAEFQFNNNRSHNITQRKIEFGTPSTTKDSFTNNLPPLTSHRVIQQKVLGTKSLIQKKDFGKYPANNNVDPDKVGGQDGIRLIAPQDKRPDDVPLKQNYRLAMHKLHNVILVLENADRSKEAKQSPDTNKLRAKMVEIQSKGKTLAKTFKAQMRNLSSNTTSLVLQGIYEDGMDLLAQEITHHTTEGEGVIKKHGYVGKRNTLSKKGTNLWRQRWLKVKGAVNASLTRLWGGWESKMKTKAGSNIGNNASMPNWKKQIAGEKWNIFYGGSLMKGYKGPPKQNTRFLASYFDVDANMDAPGIAEYLINKKGKKVDRGQLDSDGVPETGIHSMDNAFDQSVKSELLKTGIAKNQGEINAMVSEPFETRVNAPVTLGKAARKEVKRSANEQKVRDKLTQVRNTHPLKMTTLKAKLVQRNLYDNGKNMLIDRVLTPVEINQIDQLINTT